MAAQALLDITVALIGTGSGNVAPFASETGVTVRAVSAVLIGMSSIRTFKLANYKRENGIRKHRKCIQGDEKNEKR
jgi:hypothetical protein